MHEEIRNFYLEGELGGTNVGETKQRLIDFVESLMRDQGYVPVLDMDPHFTRTYDPTSETFRFELSIYGTKVGKESAWATAGVMNGKPIQKYIPQNKSTRLPVTVG